MSDARDASCPPLRYLQRQATIQRLRTRRIHMYITATLFPPLLGDGEDAYIFKPINIAATKSSTQIYIPVWKLYSGLQYRRVYICMSFRCFEFPLPLPLSFFSLPMIARRYWRSDLRTVGPLIINGWVRLLLSISTASWGRCIDPFPSHEPEIKGVEPLPQYLNNPGTRAYFKSLATVALSSLLFLALRNALQDCELYQSAYRFENPWARLQDEFESIRPPLSRLAPLLWEYTRTQRGVEPSVLTAINYLRHPRRSGPDNRSGCGPETRFKPRLEVVLLMLALAQNMLLATTSG